MLAVQVLLQDVYHTQPGISCLILKLAADIVEAHISYAQVASAYVVALAHPATWPHMHHINLHSGGLPTKSRGLELVSCMAKILQK